MGTLPGILGAWDAEAAVLKGRCIAPFSAVAATTFAPTGDFASGTLGATLRLQERLEFRGESNVIIRPNMACA